MPVTLSGKLYNTVQERLKAAHGEDAKPTGVREIRTDIRWGGVQGHAVVVATVVFADGREFTGMSLARFDATRGADATNPVECAETSAVGRALAFAGYYGSDDGLAGAEELRDAQRFGPVNQVRKPGVATNGARPIDEDLGRLGSSAAPRPVQRANPQDGPGYDEGGPPPPFEDNGSEGMRPAPATPKQLTTLASLSRAAGKPMPAVEGLSRSQASALISDLIQEKSSRS